MAARYLGQFFSAYTEQQYTVVLYDEDFVGTAEDVTFASVELSYPAGNAGRFDTILASALNVKMIVNTSGLDTFVEDLAGAREGRFILQLLQGITSQFVGYVLPDLAQQEDTTIEVGYILDLQATDGLARLKTIDYNNAGTAYTDDDTVIEHIFNCLNKLTDVLGFYSGSNWLLRTVVNWHAQQYTYSADIDPLLQSRIPHRAFYTIDTRGNYKFKTCFEVLDELCKAWGARMLYSNYSFWFVQVNELATPSAKKVFNYTKTQVQTSGTVDLRKDHDQTDPTSDLLRLAGGVYRFYPPLMKVQVDYRHIATENLLAGKTFSYDTAPNPFAFGSVDYFGGFARFSIRVNFTYRAENRDDPPGVVPLWFVFAFRIQVADIYLDRPVVFSGGTPGYGATVWTGSSAGRYEIAVYVPENEDDNYESVAFITPALPATGNFVFDINLDQVFNGNGTEYVTPVADYIWRAESVYVEHLYEGTLDTQSDIRRFVAVNDEADNSAMIELATIIGDGIGTNSPGHLEVQDDSDDWVLSDGWRVGNSGSFLSHSALLAQEIIRGQLTPVRRFLGRYHNRNSSIYFPHHVIDRADGVMVFGGGTFRPAVDEVNGEWFFITPQSTGWTNEPYVDIPGDQSASAGRPSGGGGGSGGNVTPLRIFSQSFTGTTSDTVTITVNAGQLPTNAAAIIVDLNGQMLNSTYYTVAAPDIQLTFNLESTDVLTIRFFI